MKEQDEIEQLFSSNFDGFEKAPPADVKAAIDASLFSGGAATESKKRKGIIWWFALALVIGLTGLGSAIYLSNKSEETMANLPIAKNGVSEENSKDLTSKKLKQEQNNQSSNSSSAKSIQTIDNSSSSKLVEANNAVSSNAKSQMSSTSTTSQNIKKQTKTKKKNNIFKQQTILMDKESSQLKKNIPNLTAVISPASKMLEDEPSNIQLDPYFDMKAKEDETSNTTKESSSDLSSTETKTKVDSTGITDSSTASILTTNNPIATNKPLSKTSPFSLTIYSGVTYGFSSLQQPTSSSFKMKEAVGFNSSIEMNFALNNRFGIGTGIDLNTRMDNFYRVSQVTDSVYLGLVPQYVYDPQVPDSIIDTLYVEEYDVVTNEIEQSQLIRHTSFAIPLSFNWNIYSKGRWNYRLGTIVRLSYVNNKLVSNDHNFEMPEFKKFSARIALRPQVDYTFNKIAIGAYLNCGYDLIPTVNWTDIERKRVDLGAGLLIRYKF
jgi:hypothetical protein